MDWTYDKTGNRLTETRDGVVSTYAYEPGRSRLVTVTGGSEHVLAYDDLGNATRYDDLCLDYDAAGRLVALRRLVDPAGCGADRTGACSSCATTLVQENAYDEQFRRTRRVEYEDVDGNPLAEPACTLFFYDTSSRLLAEHDCSAGASPEPALNVVAEYVYLDGYHVLAARRDGSWYWYVNDHLPTPRKLVDVAGAVVWDGRMEPFGRTDEVVSTVPQPIRSPGQYETRQAFFGLDQHVYYNHHRWYLPALGRYTQVDPARPVMPTGSSYSYAKDDPVAGFDPTGMVTETFEPWLDDVPVETELPPVDPCYWDVFEGLAVCLVGVRIAPASACSYVCAALPPGWLKLACFVGCPTFAGLPGAAVCLDAARNAMANCDERPQVCEEEP